MGDLCPVDSTHDQKTPKLEQEHFSIPGLVQRLVNQPPGWRSAHSSKLRTLLVCSAALVLHRLHLCDLTSMSSTWQRIASV